MHKIMNGNVVSPSPTSIGTFVKLCSDPLYREFLKKKKRRTEVRDERQLSDEINDTGAVC